jgi:general secretion pathway protein G
MILIAVLAVLLSVHPFGEKEEPRKHVKVQAQMQSFKTQLKLYESMNGFFPTTEQGLRALVEKPQIPPDPSRWYQLLPELSKDPWENDYVYRCPGTKHPESYDLFSPGPDHKPDTKDDDWGE